MNQTQFQSLGEQCMEVSAKLHQTPKERWPPKTCGAILVKKTNKNKNNFLKDQILFLSALHIFSHLIFIKNTIL